MAVKLEEDKVLVGIDYGGRHAFDFE